MCIVVLWCISSFTTHAQLDYKMAGPFKVVARDGEFRASKGGSERDMKAAFDLANIYSNKKASSTADREKAKAKALDIINAYSSNLERLDGHDAPLCAIQCFDMVRAMTILRDFKTPQWDAMVRNAMLPTIDKFEADSPYANGNWGAIVNRLRMAIGIYLQDKDIYQASVDYFYNANDNGALPKYVSARSART